MWKRATLPEIGMFHSKTYCYNTRFMALRILLPLLLIALAGCSSTTPPIAQPPLKPKHARIINFYGADSEVVKGHPITLCYGVEDAITVRLEPPEEELGVSRNRCFAVSPKQNTSYSLIAKGEDGEAVNQSFQVRVAPKAEQTILIRSFDVLNPKAPSPPSLCYQTNPGVKELKLDPPMVSVAPSEAIRCAPVMVAQTTTFVLIAVDVEGRQDKMQVTIVVAR